MTAEAVQNADQVRAEVRAWLAANWDPELSLRGWRERLADSGWACPTWPVDWYGKGLKPSLESVVDEEMRSAGAIGTPPGSGMGLAGPTMLEHASDDLKSRYLRQIVTGEHSWCQLFSEPGNGSDLAGLTTRAELDGDTWVISGQKVWNTSAHHADYGILLARTNWDAPKHRGITYFVIAMRQPGVTVRPLKQMNGHDEFCETFFTDVRTDASNVVGKLRFRMDQCAGMDLSTAHEWGASKVRPQGTRCAEWSARRAGRTSGPVSFLISPPRPTQRQEHIFRAGSDFSQ